MTDHLITWPPPYIIKKHPRARGVKLRASNKNGLEITVPKRFSLKHIPDVLEEHRAWIHAQLAKVALKKQWELPTHISLPAIEEHWQVTYMPCDTRLQLIQRPGYELALIGNISKKESCQRLLMKWVKAYAVRRLAQSLQQQSERTQLPYQNVSVRDQRTRWGSCSIEKNISLNFKLLFLTPDLMNYVLIHELCHTKHLNHSDRFWQLVKKYDPAYAAHRRALRLANDIIPHWIEMA